MIKARNLVIKNEKLELKYQRLEKLDSKNSVRSAFIQLTSS